MAPTLLAALQFRSNNDLHLPVQDFLSLVKRLADTKVHTFLNGYAARKSVWSARIIAATPDHGSTGRPPYESGGILPGTESTARWPADPPNLIALKAELNKIWPMTSLVDIIKETDLQPSFIDILKSPTAYETMDRSMLLLFLHRLDAQCRLAAHGRAGFGDHRQGLGLYLPPLYQRRCGAPSDYYRCRRHAAACQKSYDLEQRYYRLLVWREALQSLGSESTLRSMSGRS